jgi:predicted CXXCH cytochrome family protein
MAAHEKNDPHLPGTLDYFRMPNRLASWKRWLSAVALVASLAWGASGFVSRSQERVLYAPGPVAGVHAAWEDTCLACHEPFKPIKEHTAAAWLGMGSGGGDAKCKLCHDGPDHHENQKPDDVAWCATCHAEHRGRDTPLTRVADALCISCHADLQAHARKAAHAENSITRFDRDHPEFRVIARKEADPGKLKFNHKLHLTPGMGDVKFRIADIADSADQARYLKRQAAGSADLTDLVRLDCGACHQQSSGDFGIARERFPRLPASALLSVGAAGATMLPIVYENQCQACHPLTIERTRPGRAGPIAVPHRLRPDELRRYLEGVYTQELLAENLALFQREMPARQVPGKLPAEDKAQVGQQLRAKIETAERDLYLGKKNCGECHHYENDGNQVAPRRIVPTAVPESWFAHARFDHTAHRALQCTECHGQAIESTKSEDVLLPGIASCRDCHAPRSGAQGGIRFDCAECHRYHQEDVQSRGARGRAPTQPSSIRRFLSADRADQ